MDRLLQFLLATFAGVVLPLQVGANTRLSQSLPSKFQAAFVSFFVGGVAIVLLCAGLRTPLPTLAETGRIPWWAWMGGLGGATYVATSIWVAPRIGNVALFACITLGQAACSLVVDHYGMLGFPIREVTPGRLGGAALVLAGAYMVQKF